MKKWNRRWRFFSFGVKEEAGMTNLVERLTSKIRKPFSLSVKMRTLNEKSFHIIKRNDLNGG